jgi:deoxyribonuclease V
MASLRVGVWPATPKALMAIQEELATRLADAWHPPPSDLILGGCFVCFDRESALGPGRELAWAGAALLRTGRSPADAVVAGRGSAPYRPGLLALREGPLLEAAVRALPDRPDVLLVNATGRDHPRRAGLALHLGAVLDLPTVGVTDRTLVGQGRLPARSAGSTSPLRADGEIVGAWLRTREGVRPVAVHPGWRTDVSVAIEVVRRVPGWTRTPAPIRLARQAARRARASAEGPALSAKD